MGPQSTTTTGRLARETCFRDEDIFAFFASAATSNDSHLCGRGGPLNLMAGCLDRVVDFSRARIARGCGPAAHALGWVGYEGGRESTPPLDGNTDGGRPAVEHGDSARYRGQQRRKGLKSPDLKRKISRSEWRMTRGRSLLHGNQNSRLGTDPTTRDQFRQTL